MGRRKIESSASGKSRMLGYRCAISEAGLGVEKGSDNASDAPVMV